MLHAQWEPAGYEIDWGSAPVWVSLLAAVVAGLIAWDNSRTARKNLAIAVDKQQQDRDDRLREQADRVAAWLGPGSEPGDARHKAFGAPPRRVLGVFIRNTSEVPVYNVLVVYRDRGHLPLGHARADVLAPGEQDFRAVGAEGKDAVGVAIQFTDAAGRTWVRESDGSLHLVRGGVGPAGAPLEVEVDEGEKPRPAPVPWTPPPDLF